MNALPKKQFCCDGNCLNYQQKKLMLSVNTVIGMAFQIVDDILDLTSDSKKIGKHLLETI